MKVLVVDDDVVARMMLMHLVDSCGNHAILEAEDGAQAWGQLEAGLAPDIVFCDLRMPRMSGLELLQRVRAHGAMGALPFVLVSAASDGGTLDEAAQLGASGYIIKPFRHEDVRAQFERMAAAGGADEETPHEVARRLGIDGERLRLYLDGLARQLQAAMRELPGQDADDVRSRLVRLREGCATLGLHGAAAGLSAAAGAVPDAAAVHAAGEVSTALASALEAVVRQSARAAHAGS